MRAERFGDCDQQSAYVTEKSGNGKAVWVIAIAKPGPEEGPRAQDHWLGIRKKRARKGKQTQQVV
jgi:hypothetical protein